MTSSEGRPRIALIHALTESVEPAHAAFAEIWPEAWCSDLLDSALSADRALHTPRRLHGRCSRA